MSAAADARTVRVLRATGSDPVERAIAVEAPVAVEVDGLGYAVMMMTPADLTAFATGFMLTERLADSAADVIDAEPFEAEAGWMLRVTLSARCAGRMADRVRHRTGDTSCGLCGIASLEQLRRPVAAPPPLPDVGVPALFAALAGLRAYQPLNALTGAIHAAAACDATGEIVAAFEDVGRHNALDKLVGHLALTGIAPAFLLVTSRISFEMVDKALVARAPLLMGISAPTSMAIDHARAHRLTLIALARPDAMLVVNDPGGLFTGD
ncbi:formate dehydrogenase accessory sulfurtransferase FdhD [uncultured Sphingomonas sp.]|uniref:formate dehydrogenase accessory sulfurtransferase FdhD n=1 Tax=uncultured Sphingomonas sp. TaxID=158754 RepID=UPI0026293AC1|nr:formate dehydrogenase accessory sulfurtransferase FdhD [uncultured Sphingomonas sp.]